MSKKHNKGTKIIIIALLALIIGMISHPQTAYDSALRGLSLWWEIVVPALLPFFFLSELLLELNITRYLRAAMSPLMRPLFALPGAASLAVALGFFSGFPSGAVITAALRRKKEISREAGERLICFTNNCGPLYISVAVAGGLLHCPAAALILAISHYGGNLVIGIMLGLLSRYRYGGQSCPTEAEESELYPALFLHDLGPILKAAVRRSASSIISIGCLMAFFAVATGMIMTIRLPGNPLFQAFMQGIGEMSLGINALADSNLPLTRIIPAAAAIISFGGVSVHMQVLAMVGDTDIRIWPYLASRLIHALLAFAAASLLCALIPLPAAGIAFIAPEINILAHTLKMFAISLGGLILVSIIIRWLQHQFCLLRKN